MRWLFDISEARERDIVQAVEEAGTSSATYYVLLVLSTVIASFGLVANSTATVIGAMIVAPLMGPIVGLGLGLARGDLGMVRRALLAEVAGVAVVLATSAGVAFLVGVENVDFAASEIVGRTRPTLYDLAIGLAAGLAGAYATVNPRVSSSVAGVAIAVALVPPLSVSGLALAGSVRHAFLARDAFEAFMLFLANFLTIELAAVLLFLASGLGHLEKVFRDRSVASAFALSLVALALTGVFLYLQLDTLVRERVLRERTREFLASRVAALIPGASVAELEVTLKARVLQVNALARASQPVTPAMAADLSRDLRRLLELPESVDLDLVVGTGQFTYVAPSGQLYVQQVEPDPDQVLNQRVDRALRSALEGYPRADLVEWRRQDPAEPGHLLVTVRSPYVFDAWLVGDLQRAARERLRRLDPSAPELTLTVRTTVGQDFTAEGSLQAPLSQLRSPSEQERLSREQQVRGLLEALVAREPGSRLEAVVVETPVPAPVPSPGGAGPPAPTPVPSALEARATIRSPRLLPARRVGEWRDRLEEELGLPVALSVQNVLGGEVRVPAGAEPPSALPSPAASPG